MLSLVLSLKTRQQYFYFDCITVAPDLLHSTKYRIMEPILQQDALIQLIISSFYFYFSR